MRKKEILKILCYNFGFTEEFLNRHGKYLMFQIFSLMEDMKDEKKDE